MTIAARVRPRGCVTDLQFDAWAADELTAAESDALQRHLVACDRCQSRHAELTRERDAFLGERPELVRSRGERRTLLVTAAASVLGLAAAVALWVGPPEPPAAGVRTKGGPSIGFYVQREAAAERGGSAAKVAPFDRIRFVYSSADPAYVAIFGLDARGTASVYYPAGDRAAAVAPGSNRMLDSAVVLDGVLGTEHVFALFCDAPFAVEPVRASLELRRTLEPSAGCRLDRLSWSKEATR